MWRTPLRLPRRTARRQMTASATLCTNGCATKHEAGEDDGDRRRPAFGEPVADETQEENTGTHPGPQSGDDRTKTFRSAAQRHGGVRSTQGKDDRTSGQGNSDRTHHARDLAAFAEIAQALYELLPQDREPNRPRLTRHLGHANARHDDCRRDERGRVDPERQVLAIQAEVRERSYVSAEESGDADERR